MKKLFLILFFLPLFAKAQTDTSEIKINVSLQARDCEYIASAINYSPEYEFLFDAMKSKFRVNNAPTGNTLVALDSITIGTWLNIFSILRNDPVAINSAYYSRYEAALTAVNNLYLKSKMDEMIANEQTTLTNRRQQGRQKLRRGTN